MLEYLQGIALCSTKTRFFRHFPTIFDQNCGYDFSFTNTAKKLTRPTNLTFCGLYDDVIRFELLLLGELSTKRKAFVSETLFQCSEIVSKITRFWLFLGNHYSESLAVFCVSYSTLPENRQVKPGRFQIRSLKKFSSCTFYTLGTVLKLRIFTKNNFSYQFLGIQDCSNSTVGRCNIFIQGTWVLSKIIFDVIFLRSMGSSTQVYVYKRK